MRVEAGAPDELILMLDAEVSGLLHRAVPHGALRAGLPGQGQGASSRMPSWI